MAGPDKAALAAVRQMRIMEHSIAGARQIIGDLQTAGGDHSEDIETLDALIDSWGLLQEIAEAELDAIEIAAFNELE